MPAVLVDRRVAVADHLGVREGARLAGHGQAVDQHAVEVQDDRPDFPRTTRTTAPPHRPPSPFAHDTLRRRP
ncbi:hypothetical protein [Micromonospora sp. ATCC 39149]|uniref:hypothetical protein n=1 Tax=Micromonospora sp. (strain ATCC 39149 / NRRL 15099 / SCC 1413) TaxID=219305 RepID=UPI001E341987|nr:hypothetical protein [Micromonospora sp. ATCC 39149]